MVYTVKIVRADNSVRVQGNCTASELDKYVRNAAKQCAVGERCVFCRVQA